MRPRDLKAVVKATTEVTIHSPTAAITNKVFIERLLHLWLPMAVLPLNLPANRLQHLQIQFGPANGRT